MIRVLIYFVVLALVASGLLYLVEHPGHVTIDWFGQTIDTSAALLLISVGFAAIVLWTVLRFLFGLPSLLSFITRQRRRDKGYAALSKGLVAVGAGDGYTAGRAAHQANRLLKDDALALMLKAQAAHLNNDTYAARTTFETLAQRDDTRLFGLRGLYGEAADRGDVEAARYFAAAADRVTPLPWSTQAVLEHRASERDWESALATLQSALSAKLVDKADGIRQRAVLETAIAQDKEATDPKTALDMARRAMRDAPDLAPPVVVAARLLSRKGEIRKASKLIERAWPRCQHPDIARAYLDVRPGDSTTDRLERAQTLLGITAYDPVSRMLVARAAMANREFATARATLAPLVAEGKRPTVRTCMLMAELEEQEHGDVGLWREWIARAARAPLDPAWIADGTVYEDWAPVSPTTGKLDAFRWQVPAERLGPAMEAMPGRSAPELAPERTLQPTEITPPAHLPPPADRAPEPAPSMIYTRPTETSPKTSAELTPIAAGTHDAEPTGAVTTSPSATAASETPSSVTSSGETSASAPSANGAGASSKLFHRRPDEMEALVPYPVPADGEAGASREEAEAEPVDPPSEVPPAAEPAGHKNGEAASR